MSDLLFFKPPNSASKFTRAGSIYPPLGLCQLAAMFPPERFTIVDAEAEGLDDYTAGVKIRSINPKIVLMTASSFTLHLVERWAAWLSRNNIQLIVGGPHPTLLPQDTFRKCPSLNVMVRGEAELILPSIVTALLSGTPLPEKSCCLRGPSGEIVIGDKHRVNNFAIVPFPLFDGLDLSKYMCPDMKSGSMVTMMTSRGCSGRCSFCSTRSLHGNKLRGWTAPQVVAELKNLCDAGVQEISFFDDNFAMNKVRLIEICSGIVEQKIDVIWFCNARVDMLDEELVAAMSEAGCHQVYLGLESGSEIILQRIQKGFTLTQGRIGVSLLQKYRIDVSGGFIIGLPGETDETVDQTIAFANELQLDRCQFSRFTPLPGSLLGRATFFDENRDFHGSSEDQVGFWVDAAYRQCRLRGQTRQEIPANFQSCRRLSANQNMNLSYI